MIETWSTIQEVYQALSTNNKYFYLNMTKARYIGDFLVRSNNLSNTGVVASSYGNATIIPIITIGADGRVTSASNTTLTITHLTTSNLTEGTRLYYSNSRVYSNVVELNYITQSSLSGYATNSQISTFTTTGKAIAMAIVFGG